MATYPNADMFNSGCNVPVLQDQWFEVSKKFDLTDIEERMKFLDEVQAEEYPECGDCGYVFPFYVEVRGYLVDDLEDTEVRHDMGDHVLCDVCYKRWYE